MIFSIIDEKLEWVVSASIYNVNTTCIRNLKLLMNECSLIMYKYIMYMYMVYGSDILQCNSSTRMIQSYHIHVCVSWHKILAQFIMLTLLSFWSVCNTKFGSFL